MDMMPMMDPESQMMGMEQESAPEFDLSLLTDILARANQDVTEMEKILVKTEEDKELTAQYVWQKYLYAKGQLESKHNNWKKVFDAYNQNLEFEVREKIRTPKSSIHTPLIVKHVDTFVSNVTLRMLDPFNNFIRICDDITNIRNHKLENHAFNMWVKGNYAVEITKAIRDSALTSFGIIKCIPDYTEGIPIGYAVSPFDFFPDPFARSIDDCEFIIERTYESYESLLAKAESGDYDKKEVEKLLEYKKRTYRENEGKQDEIPDAVLLSPALSGEEVYDSGQAQATDAINYSSSDSYLGSVSTEDMDKFLRFLVVEFHDGTSTYIVGEGDHLLAANHNPYGYPYRFVYSRIPETNTIFNMSTGERLLPLQNEADLKHNQRIDNIDKIVNAPTLVEKGATGNVAELVVNKNNLIAVNKIDGIRNLEISNVTDLTFQEETYIDAAAADISAVSNAIQGKPIKQQRMSKDEFSSTFGQATAKFDATASIVVLTGIVPLIELMLKMSAKMVDGSNIPSANSSPNNVGQPEPITPSELMQKYRITVSINPNQADIDRQNALSFMQILGQHPMIDQYKMLTYFVPIIYPDFPIEAILSAGNALMLQQQLMGAMPQQTQLSKNNPVK